MAPLRLKTPKEPGKYDRLPYRIKPSTPPGQALGTGDAPILLTPSPSPVAERVPFSFLELAAELRLQVYAHLLPTGYIISFGVRTENENGPLINLTAIFYGENTFQFSIDGLPHKPVSLHSPYIFGPLGRPISLPLLRNLRRIELVVSVSTTGHWVTKRHRARLEHFVDVLKEHADDENKKSLLTNLTVRCDARTKTRGQHIRYGQHSIYYYGSEVPHKELYMYGVEPLAQLRGIEQVKVHGLPDWFANCLELCIKGDGGHLLPKKYKAKGKLVTYKTHLGGRIRTKSVQKSAKTWNKPLLDWKEFARRNCIERPSKNL
ncbi:hypothetical protein EJ04DRAFT_439321 [Polyplosphaeria fusca]|uniref:Uncharacterized protein n=1 Tax=Polyplosphaeria fusca TaxID=682080 RepID=A0A9P4QSZ5_9PLEO|nr:hypothetical protein EJ04DRAFT_439321 [Polyplosphaeria fusca]